MASRLLNLLKEECPAMQMLDLMESETPFLMAERMVRANCSGSDNLPLVHGRRAVTFHIGLGWLFGT